MTRQIRVWTPDELRNQPDPEWLIDGMLSERGTGLVVGKWGSAKTFLALDCALTVASGRPSWFGRRVRPGRIVYVAAEGAYTLKSRVASWERANRGSAPDYRVVPDAVQLMAPDDVDALIAAITPHAESRLALVVLDTLNKMTPGADENSSQDMGATLDAIERIRRSFDAAALVLHHPTHNQERARGHSSLLGSVDTAWYLKVENGVHTLRCDKMRDGPEFEPIAFRVRPFASSCVIEPAELTDPEVGLTPPEKSALATLRMQPARYTDWRRASGQSDSTFKRALATLVDQGWVVKDGDLYRVEGPKVHEGPNGSMDHGIGRSKGSTPFRVDPGPTLDPSPDRDGLTHEEAERLAIQLDGVA